MASAESDLVIETNEEKQEPVYMQNRELSWLRFNERVLDEATDDTVPLMERMGFVSIFTSNLDEFFMIRVGSLFDLLHLKKQPIDSRTGMTPREQLNAVYAAVAPLIRKQEVIYNLLESELESHDIYHVEEPELLKSDRKFLKKYFNEEIAPLLSPQIVDLHHPFPHLTNKQLYIAAVLTRKGKKKYALIPIPASVPEAITLEGEVVRYMRMDELIRIYLPELFPEYEITSSAAICVTRNADVSLDDEPYDDMSDYRKMMESVLKKRRRLAAVRLELSNLLDQAYLQYLMDQLELEPNQVFISGTPKTFGYLKVIKSRLRPERLASMSYTPFEPQNSRNIAPDISVIRQVKQKDILLSYPFESMDPFLQLIREASEDPATISIKITIYRLASRARLVEYLCSAAEKGIDVTVLIELRARFDEQNNIDWSEHLEDAGCTVLYGIEDFKVHSKLCLITRREHNRISYITQIGTGNYNESTAKQYTDLSLMTADYDIGKDAAEVFKNLALSNLNGTYQKLLVAPNSLKNRVLDLFDEEIAKGEDGLVVLKLNSLTDIDIIHKLREASCAGVKVKMYIRGICCILPGITGVTENIEVSSVVGRYLEHSRIYCFGKGDARKMYISSADFMTRNTSRRVEVAAPVYSKEIQKKIDVILDAFENDTLKARRMLPDGTYTKKEPVGNRKPLDSQAFLMEYAKKRAAEAKTAPRQNAPSGMQKKVAARKEAAGGGIGAVLSKLFAKRGK